MSDHVVELDDGVIIQAPPMEGWRVSRHRKAAIHYRGVRYQLVAVEPIDANTMRYRLVRWRDSDTGMASAEIHYDDEFVRARDSVRSETDARTRAGFALLSLYPILGFLWSGTRRTIHERYGFGLGAVAFSLFVESAAVCLMATWVLTVFIPPYWWAAAIALTADVAMRWASSLREDFPYPYGFFEWLIRWRR